MRTKALLVSLTALVVTAFGYPALAGDTPAPQSTPQIRQALGSGKKTIVFFLNPMGRPCKAQNEILQKLQQERKEQMTIAYADATKPEDQKAFYDYGVRGLPSVVVVDSSGRIGRVFPPGIQSYETLAQTLDSLR